MTYLEELDRYDRGKEIMATELVHKIGHSRTWTEALHYRGQAVKLGVINTPAECVGKPLSGITPSDAYIAVEKMLNNCFWTNGKYIAFVSDGRVKHQPWKLAADLQDEGWARSISPHSELGLTMEQLEAVKELGAAIIKEIKRGKRK